MIDTSSSSDSSNSGSVSEPSKKTVSESYSKKQLLQRWTGATRKVVIYQSTLSTVRRELKELNRDKKLVERELNLYKAGK